ncbi:uncharacterized protein LOC135501056 [Lineus longissimus]|uniref:uncharacterized protein LOC135501056 n=1 Tax=Lineus longissimus TaxID=88925 RepID=UPI00315D19D7
MAMMGDNLEMDDDFMRVITRCCQCGNESKKPDRLKFLPCSHLMCIRCLEGVRTGTNTTARTPRSSRGNDGLQNGGLTNGSHRSEDVFMTEIEELPEGKREMYTKAYCPACDQSFVVPNTNLSIFEDDFHNTGILARFITGQKHACQRCIEMEKEKVLEEAEKAKKKSHKKCVEEEKPKPGKPAQKPPVKKESRGINTSPPPEKKDDPPVKKGVNAKGPAKKGGRPPPGGVKKKGAATAKGKPPPKGAKKEEKQPSPPKSPTPPPKSPTPPPPKSPTPPASSSPESPKEGSPRSASDDQETTSRKGSQGSAAQSSRISDEPTTGEASEMTLELDGTPAEFFCMGCKRFLCSTCSHEHLTPENLKEHRLVPAHEYSLATQEEQVSCLRHPQKRYTHFCLNEKCQRAICAVCLNQSHHEHRVEPIAKVTRDPAVLREVLHNSKAIEMKVRLRMRELQESKIQDDVIASLNEEIEHLKQGYIALLDDYKFGINARFNEINGKIEIDETRVHSYMEKMKKMNGILNNVISRPDYVDQDLLILTHFLGANQDVLTNERKVEDLMREKTLVVQHYALDMGEMQSIFKSTKELPQTIPFDLHKTVRQDFPLPKHLKCTSSNRVMVPSAFLHNLDVFPNNDIVILDVRGKSIHKFQCVNAGGVKQHRFQYMYCNGGKDKSTDALVCPAGIAVYDGYTLVCDTTPSSKGAPKRGQVLVFDDKLNQIDAVPLEAVPHCMASYQDQIYIGYKTKVAHYQISVDDKYNNEMEFHLEHAGNYYVGTEWWSYLAVNREGHLAIQDGNSEVYIFKDGQQVLKPSTKLRGVRGISFFGVNKLLAVNFDKNNIVAYAMKDDVNGHPIVDKELPTILLSAKEKILHPLQAKMDYDGDLIVTDDKGQVKLYVSPK